MISSKDIQELLHIPETDNPVVSVFLDLSVNSDNKRTHQVFLNKQRSQFQSAALEDHGGGRRALEEAIDQVERWIAEDFQEENKGAALYLELGGGLLGSLQLPEPVPNRMRIEEAPVVRPLVHLLEKENRHVIAVVDREHLRLFDVSFGRILHEKSLEPEPYPAPHDVRAGGYSEKRFQQRKAEEAKHFLKDFADELETFVERHRPNGVLVLGTDENVSRFLEQVPAGLRDQVVHTGHAPTEPNGAGILSRLRDYFEEEMQGRQSETLDLLHDRVQQEHFAVSGVAATLDQLQKGKVETLVVADDLEREGARCTQCGFYLDRDASSCPYCGGETRDGIDIVETMVRQAAEQDATVRFVPAGTIARYDGVGALLRF